MLLDASVARSIAVLGWVDQLAQAIGGSLRIAHGVLADLNEQSACCGARHRPHPRAPTHNHPPVPRHERDPDDGSAHLSRARRAGVETRTRAPRTLARRWRGSLDRYRPGAGP